MVGINDINWQNLRDDLYSHRWIIEKQAGAFGLLLGIIFGFCFVIWGFSPAARFAHPYIIGSIFVLWCIELAASMVFSGALPLPNRMGLRWRYKLGMTEEGHRKLWEAGDDFTGKWKTLENRWMWVSDGQVMVVGFVRLEDYVLAKLKYSPYLRRQARVDNAPISQEQKGPSAGPHHMLI